MGTLHTRSLSFMFSEGFFDASIYICAWCVYLTALKGVSKLAPWGFGTELQKTAEFIPGPKYADSPARKTLTQYEADALIPLFSQRTFFLVLILLFFKMIHIRHIPQKCSKLNTLTQIPQSQQYFHFLLKSTG